MWCKVIVKVPGRYFTHFIAYVLVLSPPLPSSCPQHCTALTCLTVGANNSLGPEGAAAIARGCPALTTLDIGDANDIGPNGAAAIAQHLKGLTCLSAERLQDQEFFCLFFGGVTTV